MGTQNGRFGLKLGPKCPIWVQKVFQLGLTWVHRTSHDVWSDLGSGCWAFLTVFECVFEGVFERGVEGEGFRRGFRGGGFEEEVFQGGVPEGEGGFQGGFRGRRFREVVQGRCGTTCLHKTRSPTCHHMSERLLFLCFVFFLCLSCLYVLSHFYFCLDLKLS